MYEDSAYRAEIAGISPPVGGEEYNPCAWDEMYGAHIDALSHLVDRLARECESLRASGHATAMRKRRNEIAYEAEIAQLRQMPAYVQTWARRVLAIVDVNPSDARIRTAITSLLERI